MILTRRFGALRAFRVYTADREQDEQTNRYSEIGRLERTPEHRRTDARESAA